MYKNEFIELCANNKVLTIIVSDIGKDFKICFDNGVNVNISCEQDFEKYCEIKYKTDKEIEEEEKNRIPIYDCNGNYTKEFLDITNDYLCKMKKKYGTED